ncbi:glycosyltransferase [Pseudonocardia broussonetiae]|uniref:Glycosyltransferase n=1 Tax=Pseudonocardia broussonetiae TaxID=2736640 RepID=A0A6M6JNK7_9PSEU|nr:glycosyltransferase [Pseudonocardia broussonetiae]QJY48823.1 glycosyltransferase [Pseudonocardia broussonetiae]
MNILVWHVHGSWTTSFVQGRHRYLIPTLPERGPWGGGRPAAWEWPADAVEVSPDRLADEPVDLVVLQRPEELDLAAAWLRRTPGRDVAALYLEHNTPKGPAVMTRHPVADRPELPLVHVTHFNDLVWDAGDARTTVIEHGVVDPGRRYTGELASAAVVVNEPLRRGRVTGTDLLPGLSETAPLDVFGMGTDGLGDALGRPATIRGIGDLPQDRMHDEMARRRVYLHPIRWTSLGLALVEAMHLGMPVVALATTEAVEAVPPGTGYCGTDPARLADALRELVAEPELARRRGAAARAHALQRYGLDRFLADWDVVLDRTVERHREHARARGPATRGRT